MESYVNSKIDISGAVLIAKNKLTSLQQALGVEREVFLEEAEMSEDGQVWMIVLGYEREAVYPRTWKEFAVDVQHGEVRSIKNKHYGSEKREPW